MDLGRSTIFSILTLFILMTIGAGASYEASDEAYYPDNDDTFSEDASFLRVLNLNTWGLNWPWAKDREQRFRALREEIVGGDYDIVLLQEVWFRSDFDTIRTALPYITYYDALNTNCFGSYLPIGCSGLMIMSKYPIMDVALFPFKHRGSFWGFDGEIFVGKGVARARINWNGFTVDVFTTHMISYTNHPNRDNTLFRYLQTLETAKHINNSDADIKLFGGDINALPFINDRRQPYSILTSGLTDSLTDKFPMASLHPWFATFGNDRNTYTRSALPERIDYLMYASVSNIKMKTYEFIMPVFMTRNKQGRLISLSDHEAILAVYIVERKRKKKSKKNNVTYYTPTAATTKQEVVHIDSNELGSYYLTSS